MVWTFKSAQAATYVLSDSGGVALRKLEGFVNGAGAQYFLHIFDLAAVPANGITPKRSIQVIGNDGFTFSFEDTEIRTGTAMCFALSSTEETYTAVLDGAKADWEGEYTSQDAIDPSTYSTTGDLTTGRANLTVWADADNTKKLYKVYIKNNNATPCWFFILSRAATLGGQIIASLGGASGLASGAVGVFWFGSQGLTPYEVDTTRTGHAGCVIIGAILNGTYIIAPVSAAIVATADFNIKAYYK
jgi:hypothetical protein